MKRSLQRVVRATVVVLILLLTGAWYFQGEVVADLGRWAAFCL